MTSERESKDWKDGGFALCQCGHLFVFHVERRRGREFPFGGGACQHHSECDCERFMLDGATV